MPNLELKLKPSRQYLIFLLSLLFTTVCLIILAPIPFFLKGASLLGSSLYGWYLIEGALLHHPHAIIFIEHKSDGSWLLRSKRNAYKSMISGDSTVTSLISILRFNRPHHFFKKTCLIFPDSLPDGDYRRLLVVLKMAK